MLQQHILPLHRCADVGFRKPNDVPVRHHSEPSGARSIPDSVCSQFTDTVHRPTLRPPGKRNALPLDFHQHTPIKQGTHACTQEGETFAYRNYNGYFICKKDDAGIRPVGVRCKEDELFHTKHNKCLVPGDGILLSVMFDSQCQKNDSTITKHPNNVPGYYILCFGELLLEMYCDYNSYIDPGLSTCAKIKTELSVNECTKPIMFGECRYANARTTSIKYVGERCDKCEHICREGDNSIFTLDVKCKESEEPTFTIVQVPPAIGPGTNQAPSVISALHKVDGSIEILRQIQEKTMSSAPKSGVIYNIYNIIMNCESCNIKENEPSSISVETMAKHGTTARPAVNPILPVASIKSIEIYETPKKAISYSRETRPTEASTVPTIKSSKKSVTETNPKELSTISITPTVKYTKEPIAAFKPPIIPVIKSTKKISKEAGSRKEHALLTIPTLTSATPLSSKDEIKEEHLRKHQNLEETRRLKKYYKKRYQHFSHLNKKTHLHHFVTKTRPTKTYRASFTPTTRSKQKFLTGTRPTEASAGSTIRADATSKEMKRKEYFAAKPLPVIKSAEKWTKITPVIVRPLTTFSSTEALPAENVFKERNLSKRVKSLVNIARKYTGNHYQHRFSRLYGISRHSITTRPNKGSKITTVSSNIRERTAKEKFKSSALPNIKPVKKWSTDIKPIKPPTLKSAKALHAKAVIKKEQLRNRVNSILNLARHYQQCYGHRNKKTHHLITKTKSTTEPAVSTAATTEPTRQLVATENYTSSTVPITKSVKKLTIEKTKPIKAPELLTTIKCREKCIKQHVKAIRKIGRKYTAQNYQRSFRKQAKTMTPSNICVCENKPTITKSTEETTSPATPSHVHTTLTKPLSTSTQETMTTLIAKEEAEITSAVTEMSHEGATTTTPKTTSKTNELFGLHKEDIAPFATKETISPTLAPEFTASVSLNDWYLETSTEGLTSTYTTALETTTYPATTEAEYELATTTIQPTIYAVETTTTEYAENVSTTSFPQTTAIEPTLDFSTETEPPTTSEYAKESTIPTATEPSHYSTTYPTGTESVTTEAQVETTEYSTHSATVTESEASTTERGLTQYPTTYATTAEPAELPATTEVMLIQYPTTYATTAQLTELLTTTEVVATPYPTVYATTTELAELPTTTDVGPTQYPTIYTTNTELTELPTTTEVETTTNEMFSTSPGIEPTEHPTHVTEDYPSTSERIKEESKTLAVTESNLVLLSTMETTMLPTERADGTEPVESSTISEKSVELVETTPPQFLTTTAEPTIVAESTDSEMSVETTTTSATTSTTKQPSRTLPKNEMTSTIKPSTIEPTEICKECVRLQSTDEDTLFKQPNYTECLALILGLSGVDRVTPANDEDATWMSLNPKSHNEKRISVPNDNFKWYFEQRRV